MVFVYAFKAIVNRALTAILLTSAIGSLACANRGMHAPGDGGTSGAGATGGRGGAGGGAAGRGGSAGTAPGGTGGGPTGTAGRGGTTGTAGNCNVAPDAGASTGGACGAMFNFESGTQGATINAGSTAFTAVKQSGAFTFCGSGALTITALFSGSTGPTTKGEILLDLPAAPLDLTGKTITVHVAADPGCAQSLTLSLVLNTQAGPIYFTPNFPITGVTNVWKTGSATVPAASGSTTALALSLQATSQSNYQGTIYVDEIDIR
jgi:hypothetical protein